MTELGLRGACRGMRVRTRIADPAAARPADLVNRQFAPPAPNRLRVADYTYVAAWSGMVYVAFLIDTYARRILGWRAARSMTTARVLDAIEQAIWTRPRPGVTNLVGLCTTPTPVPRHLDRVHRTSCRSRGRRLGRIGRGRL